MLAHEVDHVVALKHGGDTTSDNLALSCMRCNRYKGTDLASLDPESGAVVLLYNPRAQRWQDHFRFVGPLIVPITPSGRATARLLRLNSRDRVIERAWMLASDPLGQTE